MCKPLSVECHGRAADCRDDAPRHSVVLRSLLIPCKAKGTRECRAGTAELEDFQVPRTTCNGKSQSP